MTSYMAKSKKTANMKASKMRKKGYECSTYKKKKGYGVSVTRK